MPLATAELMRQVSRIRLVTGRLVDDRLCGEYHSVFKGRGMEFDEVRPYLPGDDLRCLDWNVTARTGEPHIKRFVEERELTVIFMVDVSGSQSFGSGRRAKWERAAEITGVLALSALRNQDKVGLLLFSDRVLSYLPPRKGRTAAMRLVRDVLAAETGRDGTDIAGALAFLASVLRRPAVVFLLSDFQDRNYERALGVCARKHDIIACAVADPRESSLPPMGLALFEDPETGVCRLVDSNSRRLRRLLAENAGREREALAKLFRRLRIDYIMVDTIGPFLEDIHRLFQRRLRQRGRGKG